MHRAGLALATGDPAATIAHARRALHLIDEHEYLGQAAAAALIGLATWSSGDLETARASYTRSLENMRLAGHLADVLGLSLALADIAITQGGLRDAMHTYEQALRLNPDQGGPVLRGTADMYVGMSALHLERNELDLARQLLTRSEELGVHNRAAAEPLSLARRDGPAPTGRRRPRRGGAAARRGRACLRRRLLPERAPRAGGRGPVSGSSRAGWTTPSRGRATTASRSRTSSATCASTSTSPWPGRCWHATGPSPSLDEATELLARLLTAAEAGRRTGSVIEILALQALAARARGDLPAALVPLERALALAEPEGYVRTFVDEGPPMTALLREAANHGIATAYVARLLAAAGDAQETSPHDADRVWSTR